MDWNIVDANGLAKNGFAGVEMAVPETVADDSQRGIGGAVAHLGEGAADRRKNSEAREEIGAYILQFKLSGGPTAERDSGLR